MKITTFFYATICLVLITATSCGNNAGNNAKSVHGDSSNINGDAPVHYGPGNPADTTPALPASDDTGRRANTSTR